MSTKVVRPDPRGGRIGKALSEFLWLEAAGGIVLLFATVVALALSRRFFLTALAAYRSASS